MSNNGEKKKDQNRISGREQIRGDGEAGS